MIESIQKVIKIGSSGGVTIPAKEMKRQGIKLGDEVKITIERIDRVATNEAVMKAYKALMREYGEDIKNLAKR